MRTGHQEYSILKNWLKEVFEKKRKKTNNVMNKNLGKYNSLS